MCSERSKTWLHRVPHVAVTQRSVSFPLQHSWYLGYFSNPSLPRTEDDRPAGRDLDLTPVRGTLLRAHEGWTTHYIVQQTARPDGARSSGARNWPVCPTHWAEAHIVPLGGLVHVSASFPSTWDELLYPATRSRAPTCGLWKGPSMRPARRRHQADIWHLADGDQTQDHLENTPLFRR